MFAENTLFLEKIIAFVYNYIAKKYTASNVK